MMGIIMLRQSRLEIVVHDFIVVDVYTLYHNNTKSSTEAGYITDSNERRMKMWDVGHEWRMTNKAIGEWREGEKRERQRPVQP